MLNDAEMDDLRWKADLIGGCVPVRPEELRELLHEIARLRAEVARLEAGRLRPETVRALRKTLLNCGDWNAGAESLADLGRCYPPEEV